MSVVTKQRRERRLKLGRYTASCRQVYLSVETEGGGVRLDNKSKHKVLDSMARDWGEINSRRTILNEGGLLIKRYSCSGHGGYIVISDGPLEWTKLSPRLSPKSYPTLPERLEFYAYRFEEDCGWSRLYVRGGDKIRDAMDKGYLKSWEEWDKEPPYDSLKELAEKTYKRWYKRSENQK